MKFTEECNPVIQTLVDENEGLHFVIGITERGFEYYVETGQTAHFDFTEKGVPIKITLFGNKTRAGAHKQLEPFIEQALQQGKAPN